MILAIAIFLVLARYTCVYLYQSAIASWPKHGFMMIIIIYNEYFGDEEAPEWRFDSERLL
jgi:hypothetical protein